MTTASELRAINGDVFTPSNPGGLDGPGGLEANFPRALGLIAQSLDDMATYLSAANFVAAQASVATILQLCQALVAQITSGSTSALAFPGVDKLLLSTPNVVQTFVYDTRLDDLASDGRRWNEPGRCSAMSYWSEAQGTYTGVKRDVPAVVPITALKEQWYLHDALDLDPVTGVPRLWRASNPTGNGLVLCGSSAPITCVYALNGYVYIGSGMGLHVISLTGDWCDRYDNGGRRRRLGTFAARNTVLQEGAVIAAGALPSTAINSVHAYVYPGAPLDAAGMPLPTVLVTTTAGAAVIHPTGQVVHLTVSGGHSKGLLTANGLWLVQAAEPSIIEVGPLPYATAASSAWRRAYYAAASYSTAALKTLLDTVSAIAPGAAGGSKGLVQLAEDDALPSAGMAAHIATNFATGWQPGGTVMSTLCDATAGAITGGTVADRSYKAKLLNVAGTLQRAQVATGADVVAWSGWSAADYLERPADADLQVSGDFMIALAVSHSGLTLFRSLIGTYNGTQHYELSLLPDHTVQLSIADAGGGDTLSSTVALTAGSYGVVVAGRRGATLEIWIDGVLCGRKTTTRTGTIATTDALRLGRRGAGVTAYPASGCAMTMARVGGYMPTAAQVRRMTADEAPLFQPGAKALLAGTSTAVVTLSRDPLSGRLAVGTGDGVSVFAGLRRVAYYDADVLAATTSDTIRSVSLRGGTLLIGTANEVGYVGDAVGGKEAIAVGGPRPVGAVFVARGVTTDATPLDLAPRIFVGERETVLVEACIVGRVYGTADTERLSYIRRATIYRDAGGNVTLQGSVQTLGTDTEATSTADATLQIDTTAQTVAARVTGVASKRIRWEATFTITRVSEETSYAA